jgi:hypothetical protein
MLIINRIDYIVFNRKIKIFIPYADWLESCSDARVLCKISNSSMRRNKSRERLGAESDEDEQFTGADRRNRILFRVIAADF